MAQSIGDMFMALFKTDTTWLTPDTEKRYQNVTTEFVSVPIFSYTDMFLGQRNMNKLCKSLFELQRQTHSTKMDGYDIDYFIEVVPAFAAKWAAERRINESVPLGINTEVEVLEHINDLFLDEHYELFRMPQGYEMPGLTGIPDVNVFRQETYTQDPNTGDWEYKSPEFFTPDDMRSMGVFDVRDRQVTATGNKYRYGNEIPHWQICGGGSRKVNMVDRFDIDGLGIGSNAKKASLEQGNRGYDMSSINSSRYTRQPRRTNGVTDKKDKYRSYGDPLW